MSCIICDKYTDKYYYKYCNDCYNKIQDLANVFYEEAKKEENHFWGDIEDYLINKNRELILEMLMQSKISREQLEDYLIQLTAISEALTFEDIYSLNNSLNLDKKICYKFFNIKNLDTKNENDDIRKNYSADYRCDDGHYVRSKAEQIIDNWLYSHKILHEYEPSIFLKDSPEETIIADFYLPEKNTYIEFWGLETEKYLNRKKHKIELYKKNNIKLISLTEKEIKSPNDYLPKLINKENNK